MEIKYSDLIYNLMLFSIVVGFFLNSNQISTIVILILILVLAFNTKNEISFSEQSIILIISSIILLLFGLYFKGISIAYTILRFITVFGLYILIKNRYLEREHDRDDWFFRFMLFLIVISMIMTVIQGSEYFYFGLNREANSSAMIVFMFFMYSNKKGKVTGIIIAFLFALFFNGSRSYLALMLLFYIISFLKKPINSIMTKFKLKKMTLIFCILFIMMAIFSYYWVNNVSVANVTAYHTGLNDESNRERFVANVKALEMMKNDDEIRIWGYGSNLLEELGIDNSSSSLAIYLGTRLVQPHNSLYNPILRMGILVGIIYLFIVAKLIDRYFSKDNLAYILPYVLNAMFVHSMFEMSWLVFLIIILSLKQNKYHLRKKKNAKEETEEEIMLYSKKYERMKYIGTNK